ncbi:MAG TPA: GTPase, partial [Gammaproteobacteria bacterium]|nr:GTPase [Gammaproteobacteria bacterium]
VWHDHINHGGDDNTRKSRIIVLNKIDVLWDELSSENDINDEIASQCGLTATTLNLPADMVFPVSAQKGLVARITGNDELLKRSRLPVLERALSNMLIPAKREIVANKVRHEMDELENAVDGLIQQRLAGVDEHITELESLSNKNSEVIENMLEKVKTDKTHLEKSLLRFQATRSIFTRQTVQLYQQLDPKATEATIANTRKNMKISFTSRGI